MLLHCWIYSINTVGRTWVELIWRWAILPKTFVPIWKFSIINGVFFLSIESILPECFVGVSQYGSNINIMYFKEESNFTTFKSSATQSFHRFQHDLGHSKKHLLVYFLLWICISDAVIEMRVWKTVDIGQTIKVPIKI